MARIRTGRPNGRPPLERESKEAVVDMHIRIPMELIEKLDRLRQGAETRKDILMRIVREYKETTSFHRYEITHDHNDHQGITIPDHYPLTKQEIAELLQRAQEAWEGNEYSARTLASIQRRLLQGIPGQQCPMPDEGPVAEAGLELSKLFVSREGRWTDFDLVDALHVIMQC